MTRGPNFFIVGAAKAGTTSLYQQLATHPDIFMSPVKEPHFFADVTPSRAMRHLIQATTSEREYMAMFEGARDQTAIGESSPSYLFDPTSAQRIRSYDPAARIIAVLRDPVERAYSHYLMDVREGVQTLDFMSALRGDEAIPDRRWGTGCHLYVDLGMYAEQLQRYFAVFPREQILILEPADLTNQSTLTTVAEFLGIDGDGFSPAAAENRANSFAWPRGNATQRVMSSQRARLLARKVVPQAARQLVRDRLLLAKTQRPTMPPEARLWLQERFRADVARTRALTAQPLRTLTESWSPRDGRRGQGA